MPDDGVYPVVDYNNMAWWYPRIHAAGLPTPRTELVHTGLPLLELVDGWGANTVPQGGMDADSYSNFLLELIGAADKVRYGMGPFFLRTGHTSGKHDWEQTCYVPNASSLGDHVYSLVEHSAMADLMGLPVQDWAVRQLLPTAPLLTLPGYGNMPVVREFRYFVDFTEAGVLSAEVTHVQPYWPRGALVQGLLGGRGLAPNDAVGLVLPTLDKLPRHVHVHLSAHARAAAKAVGGGHWSVDFLEDADRNWWLTDMAQGARSYKYSPPGWQVG